MKHPYNMEDVKLTSLPPVQGLDFEDSTHTYRFDGMEVPSVSSILKPLVNEKYGGISAKTLNNAANKGTSVHNSIENWIKFGFEDVNPEHRGYFDAFKKWWNEKHPVVVASEARVFHKTMWYAGTVDLLAYLDSDLVLIDFKNTYATNDMTWQVQLEGYDKALESQGIQVDGKMILHLKKDGTYAEYKYPSKNPKIWRTFGALKVVYDYIQSCK